MEFPRLAWSFLSVSSSRSIAENGCIYNALYKRRGIEAK